MFKLQSFNGIKKENIIVWSCQSESESAKNLGFPVFVHLPHSLDYYNERGIIVIRWGIGYEMTYNDGSQGEFLNTFNTAEAISNNVNKPQALQKLSKVVLTPNIFIKGSTPKNKMIVQRPLNHSTGADFQVLKGGFNVPMGRYCTEYIPNDNEVRVWYIDGKLMMAKRVTYSKARAAEKIQCRSKWNYRFIKKIPKSLSEQVSKAIKVLDMKFGGFDIIIKDNKYYFLENNSSVSLDSPEIVKFFQDGFKSLIKKMKIRKASRKVIQLGKPVITLNQKNKKFTTLMYQIPTPNPKSSWISGIIGKYILHTNT